MGINKKVIAVDFDDTLHQHTNNGGWKNGEIDGDPMPGAAEAMQKLLDAGYEVLIYSCRTSKDVMEHQSKIFAQKKLMEGWLQLHNVPYTAIYEGNGKPYAALYIDDRSFRFTSWTETDQMIECIK